jgi:hypothetical protein
MLQAHSFLWHFLWLAPNVALFAMAYPLWRMGLHRRYPAFFVLALVASVDQFVLYVCDILPFVSAQTYWRVLWFGLLIEAVLKFVLISELFGRIFGSYTAVATLGKTMIRGFGILLCFVAALVAAFSKVSNGHVIVSGPHLLQQTFYLVESGLLFFIFLFAAYFRVRADRPSFGICLGLAVSACVHLATWAVAAGNSSVQRSVLLDFTNMTAYSVCVLIWFYYLLVPQKVRAPHSVVQLPENHLDVWNRELERLLQQ